MLFPIEARSLYHCCNRASISYYYGFEFTPDTSYRKSISENNSISNNKNNYNNTVQSLNTLELSNIITTKDSESEIFPKSWASIIEIDSLHQLSYGKGVIAAIIDSGIDASNPIFDAALWYNNKEIYDNIDNDNNGYIDDVNGWNFGDNNNIINDKNGHGTNVAGIVLECAPQIEIMPLKINPADSNTFSTHSVVEALYYAVDNGADIINLSLSLANESSEIEDAILYAVEKGITVVCAAGNNPLQISFPGNLEEVITVGATNEDGETISWNSPSGSAVDIAAPGRKIQTIGLEGKIVYVTGTSFSTPIVSGAAAVLLGMNPDLKLRTIQNLLFNSAKDIGAAGKDIESGWGVLSGNSIKRFAIPNISITNNGGFPYKFQVSCYLPPTDSYTNIYIALVKQPSVDLKDEYNSYDENIWWLNSNGIWKKHSENGFLSIASLNINDNGAAILLFDDYYGIWNDFYPASEFSSGYYKLAIGVMGKTGLLAPISWTQIFSL